MQCATSRSVQRRALPAAAISGSLAITLLLIPSISGITKEQAGPVFSAKLPNVPGKTLTAVLVKYTPGEKSRSHQHAGSVFAYVLSGDIRSKNSVTGPARVYHTGESFFEPEGSIHEISENASQTAPASLLAVFVADDGAQLTRPAP